MEILCNLFSRVVYYYEVQSQLLEMGLNLFPVAYNQDCEGLGVKVIRRNSVELLNRESL